MNNMIKHPNKTINYPHQKDTLYYDASCPLCSKEIKHLTDLQKGGLYCADIHTELPTELSSQKDNMLKILHLYQKDGSCLLGLDATVGGWQHTSLGWAFSFLRWPLIKPLADKLYLVWADKRYQNKYACGMCQE
ncbi:MAG: putative DCC family thiol-disulfide oxidoreductase YuxK [Candidatus Endobugula sp.]|jgi:predicted DCC family thiol-disulfide oxidoreductase YuxK